MNPSVIRHILTAIGVLMAAVGLGDYTGFLDLILDNLDAVWEAVMVIIGFITAIFGFRFKRDNPGDPKNNPNRGPPFTQRGSA